MTAEVSKQKREVRARVRASRAARSADARAREASRLSELLQRRVTEAGATRVTAFLSTPDEPDLTPFLAWALSAGVGVLLPVSMPGHTLAWTQHSELPPATGRHGIREPVGRRLPATAAATAELMFIPACAVDGSGTRLGWGLGYYDRLLAELDPRPPVYAVVFADEIYATLPRDPHDVPVDGAVTPRGLHRFTSADAPGDGPRPGTQAPDTETR